MIFIEKRPYRSSTFWPFQGQVQGRKAGQWSALPAGRQHPGAWHQDPNLHQARGPGEIARQQHCEGFTVLKLFLSSDCFHSRQQLWSRGREMVFIKMVGFQLNANHGLLDSLVCLPEFIYRMWTTIVELLVKSHILACLHSLDFVGYLASPPTCVWIFGDRYPPPSHILALGIKKFGHQYRPHTQTPTYTRKHTHKHCQIYSFGHAGWETFKSN